MLNVFLPFELVVHCDPEVPNTPLTSNVHPFMTNYEVVAHISLSIPTEHHKLRLPNVHSQVVGINPLRYCLHVSFQCTPHLLRIPVAAIESRAVTIRWTGLLDSWKMPPEGKITGL